MDKHSRITMKDEDQHVISVRNVSDEVVDHMMLWIMNGKLVMGEKLNTASLASELGVSRMPVREALMDLERKGLAKSIPNKGMFLVSLTKEDVKEIYLMRSVLEPLAAKCACERITDDEIDTLKKIHEDYKVIMAADTPDGLAVYEQNRLYHFSIYKASGMKRLCSSIENLWDVLSFFKLLYGQKLLYTKESRDSLISEHDSYLEALIKHDSEGIYENMRKSLLKRKMNIPFELDDYYHYAES